MLNTLQHIEKLKLYEIMNVLEEAALEVENEKQNNKTKLIFSIMTRTDKDELKFLIRFLEKNLKLGISANLLIVSLSRAISRKLNNVYEKDVHKIIIKSINQLEDENILFGHIIDLIEKKVNFYQLIEHLSYKSWGSC